VSIFNRAGVRQISQDTMADLGPGMHPRISIKGGRFTLIDAGGTKYPWPNLTLPVIVVGANPKKSKVYYDGPYDPEGTTPPTCFSDNGIAPSMNATRKMARTCAECELGAWGSDVSQMTGKPTKACDDKKKLAVIVIGDTAQLTYELQIPPATLKNLNKYAAFVGSNSTPDGSRKADVCDIVTNISFMPDQVGILDFAAAAWIDSVGPDGLLCQGPSPDDGAAIAARIDAIWDSGVIDELVGLNDKPWGGPPALAAPAPQSYMEAIANQSQPQGALMRGSTPVPVTGPYAGPAGVPATRPQQAFPTPVHAQELAAQGSSRDLMAFDRQVPVQEQPQASGRGGARAGAGRKPRTVAPAPSQALQPQGSPATLHAPGQQAQVFPGAPELDSGIPPFLRRPAANEPAPQAAHPAAGGPFGTPQPPPSGIQEAVSAAFNLSTKRN
jgi:hypothetical protein